VDPEGNDSETEAEQRADSNSATVEGPTRVTVNLRETDRVRLDEIAARTGLSKNDVIRKALATEAYVQRTLAEERKLLVEDAKGNLREIEFV
jgi:predicted transcriptional regulator